MAAPRDGGVNRPRWRRQRAEGARRGRAVDPAVAEVLLVEEVAHFERELPAARERVLELQVDQSIGRLLAREAVGLVVVEALLADVARVDIHARARKEAP